MSFEMISEPFSQAKWLREALKKTYSSQAVCRGGSFRLEWVAGLVWNTQNRGRTWDYVFFDSRMWSRGDSKFQRRVCTVGYGSIRGYLRADRI